MPGAASIYNSQDASGAVSGLLRADSKRAWPTTPFHIQVVRYVLRLVGGPSEVQHYAEHASANKASRRHVQEA